VRARAAAAALLLAAAARFPLAAQSAQDGPAAPTPARPPRPGREISLPVQQVKDSFFAYVIGIIRAGIDVDLDSAGMREVLTEFKTTLELPFDLVSRVWQGPGGSPDQRELGLAFQAEARIPIPFSLLGYHPGSILASRLVRFEELRVGYRDPREPAAEATAWRLRLDAGFLVVDMDQWIDDLLGDYVDDLPVENLVFFTWRGEWTGLLQGRGYKGQPLRAFFNFRRNRIVFPVPADLDALGTALVADRG
jgi:hypothetical protein